MNGSASPGPPTAEAGDAGRDQTAVAAGNAHHSSSRNGDTIAVSVKSSPPRPQTGDHGASHNGTAARPKDGAGKADAHEDGPDSEAETLIDSPVKKKDAEKQGQVIKPERPPKHRIGSLPVPTDMDDENDSAAVSPAPSTVTSVEKAGSTTIVKEEDTDRRGEDDADDDDDDDSDSLSSPRSQTSNPPSRRSSLSRAASERPGVSRANAQSPNPRKRKHRASSVSLPNKRPSIEDAPKRRLRGPHSEELGMRSEMSPSPKLRSHRRAISTQSAFADGNADISIRKRRAATQGAGAKESKLARSSWEGSDTSSETTSHDQADPKRPRRGIGRSTSTPGRPPGREHKRHVNKYGFTKLAEACEAGDLDLVKEWRERDPDQLELAEFAKNKPLQIAALNGNVEIVDYLIDEGCQIDCANVDKDTPLIDAAENGHLDVVNSLLRAGVDPLRQNLKGQQALDVVTDEVDDADDIRAALRKAIEEWTSTGAKQRREEEEEMRHRAGPTKELHFMARTYENLLKLVQNNDRNGVREFLDARVPVDNAVIAAAAKTGDSYLVNMLLVELPDKKRSQKPERPLLSVLGTSHYEMVKSLTELDNFDPLYHNRQGKCWPEIAEERHGPNWRQEKELLQRLYDQSAATKERRSSSPVIKRDGGKRRLISRTVDDDIYYGEAPRRKNGRGKLMSKKEYRATRGKAASDESSDESSSEMATGTEAADESSMKPPESPVSKRTPTRARTKSFSAQPPELSPRTRRRSSSVRGSTELPLPTLEENGEGEERESAQKDSEEEGQKRAAAVAQQEREREREVTRRQREQAEVEAATKRAAEEEAEAARKADEERVAEETRRAEAERQAAAAAEQARRKKEEEEEAERRRRKEEEERVAEAAKRAHRQHVLAALPRSVSRVLNSHSPAGFFDYESPAALGYLLYHFTPLQVLKHESSASTSDSSSTSPSGTDRALWLLNVQAAPLLGARGLELMLRPDLPGFADTLLATDAWETKAVEEADMPVVESVLTSLPPDDDDDDDHDDDDDDHDNDDDHSASPSAPFPPHAPSEDHDRDLALRSFDQELRRVAHRFQSAANLRQRVRSARDSDLVLRFVRLEDVLHALHPALRTASIDVRFDYLPVYRSSISSSSSPSASIAAAPFLPPPLPSLLPSSLPSSLKQQQQKKQDEEPSHSHGNGNGNGNLDDKDKNHNDTDHNDPRDFVEALASSLADCRRLLPTTYVAGQPVSSSSFSFSSASALLSSSSSAPLLLRRPDDARAWIGSTPVTVLHEK